MDFQPVASPDLVRELLIAISDSLPDNITGINSLPDELTHPVAATLPNGHKDGVEKYRSQLISISYAQSPDVEVPPIVAARPYHGRAILEDPGDGEASWLYAKFIWETQRDCYRPKSYFDQAVYASPEN